MNYKKINLYLGWVVFLIATTIFFITIEDTVSLWDCGEYITAAYKLEVGHPPGAPLFMVIGRLFSFFAEPENVAIWVNRLSALSSSMTILFMFWTLTMFVKKIALKGKNELSSGDKIAIFGAAFVGAMAYTFTESFWFSAVEGEVYAMSSMFTAVIFWAIMKWDEEMSEIKHGLMPKGYSPDRWLLLIMFMLGLAIGVHLLGILVVPAIGYVIYFRFAKTIDVPTFLGVGILSIIVLGFIQVGVISGSISIATMFEVGFVKTLGLPFYSGTIFFFLLIIFLAYVSIRFARKKGNRILYSATMGLILLLIGYGSFAVIVIRSNANTPLDENDPENLVTLQAYLKREQYGTAPIAFGGYWNSVANPRDEWKDLSPFYLRRFVVQRNDIVLKAFTDETRANEYAKTISGAEVKEDYFESNASTRKNAIATFAQTTFFPRMYMNNDPHRISGYKLWSGYDANDGTVTEKGSDGNRLPTFQENWTFFSKYQVNWMYWRYFMWNFSGRQNDIQNTEGGALRGNWITGFSAIDNARLGNQQEFAPYFTSQNPSNNKFFLLPLILGIIGLVFHYYRAPKDAFVITVVFLLTGVAIIIYLNPKPYEPRERDYAYAGSFYFFAMWIGIGVYALYDAFKSFGKAEFKKIGIIGAAVLLLTLIMDIGAEVSMPTTLSWLYMLVIGGGALGLMFGLKKVLSKDKQGAIVAILLGLFVPMIMGMQGWDDHDRSNKTTAHDLALNYLNSNGTNGILFTNGDNDTFPLWYMQEVEGKRTDVRVCNLSLMQTDWYTNQMKLKTYESDPLPILFTEDQILMHAGKTDQVLFTDIFELFYRKAKPQVIKQVIKMRADANPTEVRRAVSMLSAQGATLLNGASTTDSRVIGRLNKIRQVVAAPLNEGSITAQIYAKFEAAIGVFDAAQSGLITMSQENLQALQTLLMEFEKTWNFVDLKTAMEFTRNDDNLVDFGQGQIVRVFPTNSFILPVNIENAIASGVITEEQAENCNKELRFTFDKRGLTREQVMMLDIMANNDWKRSIGYSSPGGSDVSLALYRRGYIKQNGMVFELSPIAGMNERYNTEKMYANLMENYSFGQMNNPNVLTDYYARRHTSQYRLHFLSLAEDFVMKAFSAMDGNKRIEMVLNSGAPTTGVPEPVSEKSIQENLDKAKKLIYRSLEVMPAELVLDCGEPNGGRENYTINGKQLQGYSDGILHEYVRILYATGDVEGAEKLGTIVANQLESILTYYEKGPVAITSNQLNTKHLYAALSNYFKLLTTVTDEEMGNPDGELAKRLKTKIQYVYSTMLPSMFDGLESLANENGETTRRGSSAGKYANRLFNLQDYAQAIAQHYGLIDGGNPQPNQSGSPSIEDLMRLEAMKDSIEQ